MDYQWFLSVTMHLSICIVCAFHVCIQKLLSEGVQHVFLFFVFFLVDEGREDPNTTKSGPTTGPLVKHDLNGPKLNAGLVAYPILPLYSHMHWHTHQKHVKI